MLPCVCVCVRASNLALAEIVVATPRVRCKGAMYGSPLLTCCGGNHFLYVPGGALMGFQLGFHMAYLAKSGLGSLGAWGFIFGDHLSFH